jgi:hypothetical protein
LQNSEFLYEQPAAGDIEYRFKHALTHDVAYGSLLTERRKLLHERTAQSIEALYPERLEDHYNELAHHYRSSDNAAKAVEYLRLAGEQAVGRGLYALALAGVDPALRLIERMPGGEVRLRAELGVRLMEAMTVTALHGLASQERLDASERICQLSESLGDTVALFRGLLNMGYALNHRFEARRGTEIGRRCLKLAQEQLETDMHPAAYALLTQAHYCAGDLVEAAATGKAEMAGFFSPDQRGAAEMVSVNLWAIAPLTLAWIKHAMGYPDEGLALGRLSLSRARELKQALALVSIMYSVGVLHFHRNEPAAVRELVEAEIVIAEESGLRVWISNGRALRAWAMSKLGQAGEAVVELESAVASAPTLQDRNRCCWRTSTCKLVVLPKRSQGLMRSSRE